MYMNKRKNITDKYKKQSIMTASKEELVLMLYNGCIKDINKGIEYIDDKNIEKTNSSLKNAQNIISHLRNTLDKNIEISKNMDNLYEYIYNLLIQGNIKKDTTKLKEAKDLVEEFRNSWHEAVKSTMNKEVKIG